MSNTELVTESLTEREWGIAHAIAQSLVKEQTDVNELGKAIAYLRASVNEPNASRKHIHPFSQIPITCCLE